MTAMRLSDTKDRIHMDLRDTLPLLGDGLRIALGAAGRGFRKPKPVRYEGTAVEICERAAKACWNGRYFQAGGDHFSQLWIRDFALALPGLLDLGMQEESRATLRFALDAYAKTGRVTTTVLPSGIAVDVFRMAADSLPFLLYALLLTESLDLLVEHNGLLAAALNDYADAVTDPVTGALRTDTYFPTAKDMVTLPGSCSALAFIGWTDELAWEIPGLGSPFHGVDFHELLVEGYWEQDHFINDPESRMLSADANLWPFWCGVVDDGRREQKAIRALQNAGLEQPFPLKYHAARTPSHEHPVARAFVPNYQGNTIWTMLALQWIERVSLYDPEKARDYLRKTAAWVESNGNWIELFEPDGSKPYEGPFGHGAAQGLIWAANFPRLWKESGLGS